MKSSERIKITSLATGFLMVLSFLIFPLSSFAADVTVSSIEVSNIKNNSAQISWRTGSVKTKGVIYLGENKDSLTRTFSYNSYDYSHQITLTGLESDKTYFYKIVVIENSGDRTELFIRSFSTKEMIDTNTPDILSFEVVQSAYQAALFRWSTDEETNAVLEYGTSSDQLDKKVSVSGYETTQEKIITGFDAERKYYVRLTVYDRDKNKRQALTNFTAYGKKADATLNITAITPIAFDEKVITSNTAEISFRTSMPAKSKILYGTEINKLKNAVAVSELHEIRHKVKLEDLKANTIYFFVIKASDSFYSESAETSVMSFKTGDVSSRIPSGSLVRARGDYKVYFVNKYTKAWISSAEVFQALGYRPSWVKEVAPEVLNEYEEISKITSKTKHPDGTLVRYAKSPTVYLVEDGKKRPIGSPEAFNKRGLKWDWIMIIPDKEKYTTGDYLS